MEIKKFKGIEFVKVGSFTLGDAAIPFKRNGKDENWVKPTLVNLIKDEVTNTSSSCYLVTLGEQPTVHNILYVGMYTNTFGERWFKQTKHEGAFISWHSDNMDNNMNILLKKLHRHPLPENKKWCANYETHEQKIEQKLNMLGLEKRIASDNSADKALSLWLVKDPFITFAGNESFNVATSIEEIFLKDTSIPLPFNSKGRKAEPKKSQPLLDIIGS